MSASRWCVRAVAEALLGLGGNLGDVPATLTAALDALCQDGAIRLAARSANYRTPPWGYADQPPFINACAAVQTESGAYELLARALAVERRFGRVRDSGLRFGPRPLDIDILLYGDLRIDDGVLTIPHPRMLERAFVLIPLVEIRPDLVIDGRKITDVLAGLDVRGIERLPS
jgi:2-amino-4-hydroxy-6-hydroxymethyldihydropteridine diphosphokinase